MRCWKQRVGSPEGLRYDRGSPEGLRYDHGSPEGLRYDHGSPEGLRYGVFRLAMYAVRSTLMRRASTRPAASP